MIPQTLFDIVRFPSREVCIGDRPLGGNNPIRLQSMTNTPASDIESTVNQCIRIIEAGADYVRISTPNQNSAHEVMSVKKKLRSAGFTNPLIADIHFNPEVALIAARHVEKIRINPGNYTGAVSKRKISFSNQEIEEMLEKTRNKIRPLVDVCKENGTVIRIGTNMGSLSPRIIAQYGNTPAAMVASTLEFLEIFRSLGFHDLVISLKTSKPVTMIQAYEEMVEKMLELGMDYPLHVGITEAGEGENGRIKSALGICTLLNKGIGDTVRVSLTEKPENEIPFAKKLTSIYQIPFAEKREKESYNLRKLAISTHELFPLGDKRRALVIEDQNPDIIAKEAESNVNESDEKNKPGSSNTHAKEADVFFIKNISEADKISESIFLLPTNDSSIVGNDKTIVLRSNLDGISNEAGQNSGVWMKVSCPPDDSTTKHLKEKRPGTILIDLNG
ncbi:MAG: (E)-4-hydroxy-3-methylbut-2-enyl-diphosphate synthase, partial [Bacteroidota bacterium]